MIDILVHILRRGKHEDVNYEGDREKDGASLAYRSQES
jgi:hypothetical protein